LRRAKRLEATPYQVDQEKCTQCHQCVVSFSCPALFREGDVVHIEESMCTGCGMCAQVCPVDAIEVLE
ncbi:MAG: 4Fe-4S binding protein, partial [Methanomassiliicoccales archaeon]